MRARLMKRCCCLKLWTWWALAIGRQWPRMSPPNQRRNACGTIRPSIWTLPAFLSPTSPQRWPALTPCRWLPDSDDVPLLAPAQLWLGSCSGWGAGLAPVAHLVLLKGKPWQMWRCSLKRIPAPALSMQAVACRWRSSAGASGRPPRSSFLRLQLPVWPGRQPPSGPRHPLCLWPAKLPRPGRHHPMICWSRLL